jgi:hypothetical protein
MKSKARDVSHRINDPALKELEEATWVSYRLCREDFDQVKFPKWSQWYLTMADPPRTITGHLPRPLGKSVPIKADWHEICEMDSPEFMKLHKQALSTVFKECTMHMHVAIKRMATQARSTNVSLITVLPSTPVDTLEMIRGWQLNPHGVLPVVQQESDGTMNLHNVDIWMWLQNATPKKCSPMFRKSLWTLFQQSGRWCELASDQRVPPPIGDTFCTSIMEAYDWGDRHPRDHSEKELAQWLRQHGGINISRAALPKIFAERLASGLVCNHPAMLGKRKWEALGAPRRYKALPSAPLWSAFSVSSWTVILTRTQPLLLPRRPRQLWMTPHSQTRWRRVAPHMIKMIIWTLTLWSSYTRSCMVT